MASSEVRVVLAIIFIIISVLALVFNFFVFFTCGKRQRLRKPSRYFLISIAVADILSVFLWTCFTTGSVLEDGWISSIVLCKTQEYFKTLFLLVNMHTFSLLSIERCIYFFKPSRHIQIFINTVAFIMLIALWAFDAVMAALPFANWGEITYFDNQYQCAMNFEKNVRHMNFMTTLTFGIPLIVCLVTNLAIFVRLRKLKKEKSPEGAIILEVDSSASGDSYSHRLKNLQLKFQNAGVRQKKPVIGKKLSFTNDGYVSNDSSGDEMPPSAAGYVAQKEKKQKKVHFLSRNDLTLIKTYIFLTLLYTICWIPYVTVMYIVTYDRYKPIPDALVSAFVALTHCSLFIKPLIYVVQNDYFRVNFKKSLNKEKYKSFDKRPINNVEDKNNENDSNIESKNPSNYVGYP